MRRARNEIVKPYKFSFLYVNKYIAFFPNKCIVDGWMVFTGKKE
jgi:hypothetical protein